MHQLIYQEGQAPLELLARREALRDCWLADQGCLGPVHAPGGALHQLQQVEAEQSEGEQTYHDG